MSLIRTASLGAALAIGALACGSQKAAPGGGAGPVGEDPRGGDAGAPAPAAPTVSTPKRSGPAFKLDTTTRVVDTKVHGGPPGAKLSATLCSDTGQRQAALVPRAGVDPVDVAACAWLMPPVASYAPDGEQALVCYNRLVGPAGEGGGMPSPSAGMPLLCRHYANGALKAERVVADDAPSWLIDVAYEGGAWRVRYFRNASGTLVGPRRAGDGRFERTFDGAAFSAPLPMR